VSATNVFKREAFGCTDISPSMTRKGKREC